MMYVFPTRVGRNRQPHGLNQSPDFIIVKSTSHAKDWKVHAPGLTSQYLITLNETYAPGQSSWDGVTDTVFKPARSGDTYLNTSTQTFIAYCWHNIPGLQKFGQYEGNNSTDGPYIELGFRPSIMIFRNIDSTSPNWEIYDFTERDKTNPYGKVLSPNTNGAESDVSGSYPADALSNGIKIRHTGAAVNAANTYIYAAWAEAPSIDLFGGGANAR